jgi:hypothetical protein
MLTNGSRRNKKVGRFWEEAPEVGHPLAADFLLHNEGNGRLDLDALCHAGMRLPVKRENSIRDVDIMHVFVFLCFFWFE